MGPVDCSAQPVLERLGIGLWDSPSSCWGDQHLDREAANLLWIDRLACPRLTAQAYAEWHAVAISIGRAH